MHYSFDLPSFVAGTIPRIVPVHKVQLHDGSMVILENLGSITPKFIQDNLADARNYYLAELLPEMGYAYRFVVMLDNVWTKLQSAEDEDRCIVSDVIYIMPE
jgi:hypothetical protein